MNCDNEIEQLARGISAALSAALGASSDQPRGLQNFIQDIRKCSNHGEEQTRVDKELGNIRQHFQVGTGLNSYRKKKYVWKLVYIYMLGYDVDFGHMEIASLLSSPKYSEKSVGYIAASVLIRPGDDLMSTVIITVKNDLRVGSNPVQNLALCTVANLGGSDFRTGLIGAIHKLLMKEGDPGIRKKAALCLLRFFIESPDDIDHQKWAESMLSLLEDKHLGVVTSCMALLLGLATANPLGYEGLVPYVIHLLVRLAIHKACPEQYLYCDTPHPWLQIKLLKFLQLYPLTSDPEQRGALFDALTRILTKTEDHAILFEAVNLIIHQGQSCTQELRSIAMSLLGCFISVKEPNIRYIGLEAMSRLARLEGSDVIKSHKETVMISLKDADISIKRRALDLLFFMSNNDNAVEIVDELVTYLALSEEAIREEMVLKIAIIAERYNTDWTWYLDTMLSVLTLAGDFVPGDAWHRIIHATTNNKELQAYAAEKMFKVLQGKRVDEAGVAVGGYILGEFGYFIAEQIGMRGQDQFHTLHRHWIEVSIPTKALLLSTYAKLSNLYPECRELVRPVFIRYLESSHLELQQRSAEYLNLMDVGADIMEEVLKEMPPYAEGRETALEARLRKKREAQFQSALTTNEQGGKLRHDSDSDSVSSSSQSSSNHSAAVMDLLDSHVQQYDQQQQSQRPLQVGQGEKVMQPSRTNTSLGYTVDDSSAGYENDVQGIPTSVRPNIKLWFVKLALASQGILYEDTIMRIGVLQEYHRSQGRLMLYFYNLTNVRITELDVKIPNVPFIVTKLDAVPSCIDVGKHIQVKLACECMQPFTTPLELRVSFAHAEHNTLLPLHLPAVLTCFVKPVQFTVDEFVQRWSTMAGDSKERQEILQVPGGLTPGKIETLEQIIVSGMHMGLVQDFGIPQLSIFSTGTFHTGSVAQSGRRISVGVMMKVEVIQEDLNSIKISVRAMHGGVSTAVKDILRLIILTSM